MTDTKPKVKIDKKDNSLVVIEGEIATHLLDAHRTDALKALGQKVKIDGFRPGNIPAEMLEKHVGELAILDEMANLALSKWYPQIVIDHEIEAIGRPEIKITKLAAGNPLEFTITTAVMPTVKLADYKKIAKKVNKKDRTVKVEDAEVEEAITQLRRFRAQAHLDEEKSKIAKEKGEKFVPTKLDEVDDDKLPELTLDYVKNMGDFKSIEEFKEKLEENLIAEKEKRSGEERRMESIEEITDNTKFDIPELLINYEIDRSMAQLEHDIAMSGLEFKDYLENIKKTKEEIRDDMRESATKRTKTRLVIEFIAKEEKLSPDAELVQKEVTTLMEMYKDNPNTSEESIRAYVSEILLNQTVFEFLDAIK